MNPAFEKIAKMYSMDLSSLTTQSGDTRYFSHVTQMAFEMWCARQLEIDRLTHEVCDLGFAVKACQHVLDRERV